MDWLNIFSNWKVADLSGPDFLVRHICIFLRFIKIKAQKTKY